jgi:hypothetical protein
MYAHSQHSAATSPATDSMAIHGSRPRRPSSLPSVPADIRMRKPYAGHPTASHLRLHSASPQVISNLIDSLSAISVPANNHFDYLPTNFDDSFSDPASERSSVHDGSAVDRTPYYQNMNNLGHEYDNDACEPPVVRTSKPPSGLSSLTAPKKRDNKENSLRSYISRSRNSSASVQSSHSLRTASSIGNISIEAGVPRLSNGSNRTSSESKSSAKGHRSLLYMPSRERMRMKDSDRKRASVQAPEVATSFDTANKSAPQRPVAEDTINEEPVVAESSRNSPHYPGRGISPLPNGVNLLHERDGGSPTEQGLIPERASSLRHSNSPSKKGKKGHDRKIARNSSYTANTLPEEDEGVDHRESVTEKILEDYSEENEVARRIHELKTQKLLRDELASSVSATSPTSGVSQRMHLASPKAIKVLGITLQSQSPNRDNASQGGGSHETRASDEFTPLPINYQLALQALDTSDLEHKAFASTPPDNISTETNSTEETVPDVTPERRTKSLASGEPSAIGRKPNTIPSKASMMGFNTSRKDATSAAPHTSSDSGGARSPRSISSETHARPMASSTSHSLHNRPPHKQRQYSHPDLPLRVQAPQVRKPSVVEEQLASTDSIDADVDAYLNSPRLSQKIRHPQTGRVISFSEVGDSQGFAVFVCVGMGLSRYVMAFYDQLALTLKLRLITPERPGIGSSEHDPNGTPLSWPGKNLPFLSYTASNDRQTMFL